MYVRVRSWIENNPTYAPMLSNIISVTVKPYELVAPVKGKLWVPGDYQDYNPLTGPTWTPSSAPFLDELSAGSNIYEGVIDFYKNGTSSNKFKFTPAANWDNSYGTDGTLTGLLYNPPPNIDLTIPTEEVYKLNIDINTLKWTATRNSWALVGPAGNGWPDGTTNLPADMDLRYNNVTKIYEGTFNLNAGDFKFRLNDAWNVDYGFATKAKSTPVATDNTPEDLGLGGADMNIAVTGNYTIKLDLENKTLKVKKN
jgi:starch-binding outer membrane protein SusE/F